MSLTPYTAQQLIPWETGIFKVTTFPQTLLTMTRPGRWELRGQCWLQAIANPPMKLQVDGESWIEFIQGAAINEAPTELAPVTVDVTDTPKLLVASKATSGTSGIMLGSFSYRRIPKPQNLSASLSAGELDEIAQKYQKVQDQGHIYQSQKKLNKNWKNDLKRKLRNG